jgi:hypothetical protein
MFILEGAAYSAIKTTPTTTLSNSNEKIRKITTITEFIAKHTN